MKPLWCSSQGCGEEASSADHQPKEVVLRTRSSVIQKRGRVMQLTLPSVTVCRVLMSSILVSLSGVWGMYAMLWRTNDCIAYITKCAVQSASTRQPHFQPYCFSPACYSASRSCLAICVMARRAYTVPASAVTFAWPGEGCAR